MVKFLSGGQREGERIPLCTYWRNDLTTDPTEDLAPLVGTGEEFAQKDEGQNSAIGDFDGQCIANAFFKREDITCFNLGRCDEEGKCLPCSKYVYGGMRMAISHSPPVDILKNFDKGLTDKDLRSPNLVRFPPNVVNFVAQDQLPYHIILRNIQASIAKCCHWNQGDGAASEFFLAKIIAGPETAEVTDGFGNRFTDVGIIVKHPEFPDTVGTFFPVGTVVVAGFKDQPSFYLEPRTGLFKPGEGIIFAENLGTSATNTAKSLASQSTPVVIDAELAADFAASAAEQNLIQATNFFNQASATNEPEIIEPAQTSLDAAQAESDAAAAAADEASTLKDEADVLIVTVRAADPGQNTFDAATDLATKLEELAEQVEITAINGGGGTASQTASAEVLKLRALARDLNFAGLGAASKCEFAFEDNNVAKQWNLPEDGTLICNGVRTDCDFYTGEEWEFATDEKMDVGQPITGDQLQEVRVRSDDFGRFSDPSAEFETRFATPFIWAFKGYTEIQGDPRLKDMELYRPNLLFGRGTAEADFDTILLEKIIVTDFDNFDLNKQTSRIQPGSESLDIDQPPQFPSIISKPVLPTNVRLKITHPREIDEPFVYRTWSPNKNKISIFGTATPDSVIYLVNDTALQNRQRYHGFLGTRDFVNNLPIALPATPNFNGVFSFQLLELFRKLEEEQLLNPSAAPLGFSKIGTDREGFWQSISQLDLVHNSINRIFAFLLINDFVFTFDATQIDYRFVHSIMAQTSFQAKDFTINDSIGSGKLGANTGNSVDGAILEAETKQIVGGETISVGQAYYGHRFKDRNLRNTATVVAPDLQGDAQFGDQDPTVGLVVNESDASAFITRVGYNVIQYRKEIDINFEDWYVIDDCGKIMIRIRDEELHRVLPLPDQSGTQKALTDVLVNGGSRGSIIAQWAPEKITLRLQGGENKDLGLLFRDPGGVGLPANYIIVGPKPASNAENAFGRPIPGVDSISLTVTFLRSQTAGLLGNDPSQAEPELSDEVVKDNFNDDNFIFVKNTSSLQGEGEAEAKEAAEAAAAQIEDPEEAAEKEAELKAAAEVAFADETKTRFIAGADERSQTSSQDVDIQDDQQDYVFIFIDSEGRPIGRKISRFMVLYHNIAVTPIEIVYQWRGNCTTFALVPSFDLTIGDAPGQVSDAPRGVTDPFAEDLSFGFKISDKTLGEVDCVQDPSCGDHEFINFGQTLVEFETIGGATNDEGAVEQTAFFPSAGDTRSIPSTATSRRPGTQVLRRKGPLWYPYNVCERPRYNFRTNGPLHTDSTELINTQTKAAGVDPSGAVIQDGQIKASQGEFGPLPAKEIEAYRGPDMVTPKILDVHPSLRACTSGYTYGNTVLTGGVAEFSGGARKRAEVNLSLYEPKAGFWVPPPFGNFGRNKVMAEVSIKRGDYLGGTEGDRVGFRWMPIFPEREDLGATLELFSEEIESQPYRLISTETPVGAISEIGPTRSSPRFSHKGLIFNQVLAGIEYPFSPFHPIFLPDADLGEEPEERESDTPAGEVTSTLWAWREQEKPIGRGAGEILEGIQFQSPDYLIDNRRLEIRLRPDEDVHEVKYRAPQYNNKGELKVNGSIQLDDGPPRFIKLDFVTKTLSLALSQDPNVSDEGAAASFYDTSKKLGEGVFECEEGTPTDNLSLLSTCTCEADVENENVDTQNLPASFLHLEQLAPPAFSALYASETIETPFAVDIAQDPNDPDFPCCRCLYYVRGIFFSLNSGFLPLNKNLDPAFDSRFIVDQNFLYTWSRVPHGFGGGLGDDGVFNSTENLADDLVRFKRGQVFTNRFLPETKRVNIAGTVAFFPSVKFAQDNTIIVKGLDPGDPKLKGGIPVDSEDRSQGQPETIILDMQFDTYVRIQEVIIRFRAGTGFEVPPVTLGVVDPENRAGQVLTLRKSRTLATSTLTAVGSSLPNAKIFRSSDIQDGTVLFPVSIFPSYTNVAFWNQFGQEFHLVFDARTGDNSMGIASIEIRLDTFISTNIITENITINERKYYTSTGDAPGGINPELFLSEVDSATGYWRTAEVSAVKGANRNRAYAFGTKLTEDGDIIRGEPRDLEQLQEKEYENSRDLMAHPYIWGFTSFIPLDEAEAIDFYGGRQPTWTCQLEVEIGKIEEVSSHSATETNPLLLYGVVPIREPWNAPGHTWTYSEKENYQFCCFPCPKAMVIDYNFAHLHDGLAVVETARFWDELPSGFTRLIRSTMLSPDATFGQTLETGVLTNGGPSAGPVLIDSGLFVDSQGNEIDASILENAGLRKSEDGDLVIIDHGGL